MNTREGTNPPFIPTSPRSIASGLRRPPISPRVNRYTTFPRPPVVHGPGHPTVTHRATEVHGSPYLYPALPAPPMVAPPLPCLPRTA